MQVEVLGVELVAFGKVGDAHAEVAELVDWCWSLLKSPKGVLGAVLFLGLL
jgi:hypothetical protein